MKKLLLLLAISLGFIGSSNADFQYAVGEYYKDNYETAFKEFQVLAEQGNGKAQSYLVMMYEHGKGVDKDQELSKAWKEKSLFGLKLQADQGDPEAQYWLASNFFTPDESDIWYKKSFNGFLFAANQGDPYAQSWLYYFYIDGIGVDTDDAGSDTFDSRLAYVGVDAGAVGAVSMGRQTNPGAGVSKTNIFNVYGGNATFNYADRSSNTVKYSNTVGPVTLDALAVIDGATGKTGMDVTDISASMDIGPISVAGGMVNDKVNVIKYRLLSGSIDIAGITLASTYSVKDVVGTADLTGMEYTASTTLAGNTVSVGFQDKEGTAKYYTAGVSRDLSSSLSTYVEYQSTDLTLASSTDTSQMALGLKFTF